jgi:hypothetical protein
MAISEGIYGYFSRIARNNELSKVNTAFKVEEKTH